MHTLGLVRAQVAHAWVALSMHQMCPVIGYHEPRDMVC